MNLRVALGGLAPWALILSVPACSGLFGDDEEAPARRFGGSEADAGGATSPQAAGRVVCDDRIHAAASEGRRITRLQYQRAIADVFDGLVPPSTKFPGTYGKSATGFSTEAAVNALGEQDVANVQAAAEEVALAIAAAGTLPKLLPCAAASPNETCAGTFIDKFARRAYRRAPSAEERTQLLATYKDALAAGDGATFSDGIAFVVAHMLQTAQFLYVMEDAAPKARALSGEEIASRLSFLLWDSIPDEALLSAAASGALADKSAVLKEATRMLASDKANTAVARFFREWTGTQTLLPTSKDAATFPGFEAAAARSMNESFDRFVVDEVRAQGTVTSLLKSPAAHVDAAMASFFGVAAPAAGAWAKVSLDATRFSGIATQPALMASLAHPTESSFVARGKFITTRLLCESLGEPPADALALFGGLAKPPQPTGKEVSATITAQPACGACHKAIDPPGLAFEHFDGLGRYRDKYASGKPIDTSGALFGKNVSFAGPADLMDALSKDSAVAACFTKQVFRHALSRKETDDDACALQALDDALKASGGKLADALLAITTTEAFTHRIDP